MITESIKQKWAALTIGVVETSTYRRKGHMITIGKIPIDYHDAYLPIELKTIAICSQ